MGLIGNYSVLAKHPGRDCGGGAIGLGHNRGDFGKPSARRGAFNHPGWDPLTSVPDGYRPPYTWVLPQTGGGLAARNIISGTGTLTAAGAMGVNGEAALAGTGALSADLQLIVSAVAALTGTGTVAADVVAVLQAIAALAGTGALTATRTAIGHAAAALAGTGTATPTINALGELEAALTIAATTDTPTADEIAAAVWDRSTAGHVTDGTFGRALGLLHALGRNRVVTDPAAGTFTVYDDDDVTVLLTGDLWQDADATTAYAGSGAERRDRLT